MIAQGALPPDIFTALAVLFLLFGVPLILFGLIMLYTGYVQYDGEQYVKELEEEAGLEGDSTETTDDSTDPVDEDDSSSS